MTLNNKTYPETFLGKIKLRQKIISNLMKRPLSEEDTAVLHRLTNDLAPFDVIDYLLRFIDSYEMVFERVKEEHKSFGHIVLEINRMKDLK